MFEVQPDQLDIIVADLDLYTKGEIVALALNMDANLRDNPPVGTPIDTGWASANWMPSIGEPAIIDATLKHPQPADVAARAMEQGQGLANVLAWTVNDGPIFDTNNVPYIEPLNNGHSPQSPPGWVQAALEKAVRETESAGANRVARERRATSFKADKPRPKR